ncbi:MAG: hypothetical protein U0M42_06125 [Acutalibacteraceae bacterium]|nr:hypothetical protein [Acutalibacteraceae bacterium]
MAKFFGNNQNTIAVSQKEQLQGNYSKSVGNLLLVIVFTVVNIILLVSNSNTYFLFSAFVPYFIADYGMFFTGKYPEAYYEGMTDFEFVDISFLYVTLAVSAVVIVLYLLSWIFARKGKIGWLYVATVMFVIDTLAMFALTGFSTESIIDIVFHAWVLYCLINGIVTFNKIKKLPDEEPQLAEEIQINGETLNKSQSFE